MSINQVSIECPICYDDMDLLKNCVTTECGHKFHCSCLMKNASVNGFSCPMCRNVMAEEPESDDDDYSDDDYESEYDDFVHDALENNRIEDNMLTGFRMFHQQINGEEVELEQEEDEEEEEEVEMVKPSAEFIAAKLIAQGFTVTDMVKSLLLEHEEYSDDYDENHTKANQLFGALRVLINNYPRQSQIEIEKYEKAAETQRQVATRIAAQVSSDAQEETIVIKDGEIFHGRQEVEQSFGNQVQRYIMNNIN